MLQHPDKRPSPSSSQLRILGEQALDPNRKIRLSAVQDLMSFAESNSAELPAVAVILTAKLGDEDILVVDAALLGLIKCGPAAAIALPKVLELFSERDAEIKYAVLRVIEATGTTLASLMEISEQALNCKSVGVGYFWLTQLNALAIAELSEQEVQRVVQVLADFVPQADEHLQRAVVPRAIEYLGKLGVRASGAIDVLKTQLEEFHGEYSQIGGEEEGDFRFSADDNSGETHSEFAADERLLNQIREVRKSALGYLIEVSYTSLLSMGVLQEDLPYQITELVEQRRQNSQILTEEIPDVLEVAEEEIPGRHSEEPEMNDLFAPLSSENISRILKQSLADRDPIILNRISFSRSSLDPEIHLPLVVALANSGDTMLQFIACSLLYGMAGKAEGVLDALVNLLNEKESDVVVGALGALRYMENKARRALPRIAELRNSTDLEIKGGAERAFSAISD